MSSTVFPVDYIVYTGIVLFLVLSSMSGMKAVGIRICWVSVYRIRYRPCFNLGQFTEGSYLSSSIWLWLCLSYFHSNFLPNNYLLICSILFDIVTSEPGRRTRAACYWPSLASCTSSWPSTLLCSPSFLTTPLSATRYMILLNPFAQYIHYWP